uniref:Uncharacterized protein n=1 Tax=Arundo donax TaxID=35708 RepID=A0A0A9DPJ8_ARUDO
MRKHALHLPVLRLRAGCLLISTDPSLVYSEPTTSGGGWRSSKGLSSSAVSMAGGLWC